MAGALVYRANVGRLSPRSRPRSGGVPRSPTCGRSGPDLIPFFLPFHSGLLPIHSIPFLQKKNLIRIRSEPRSPDTWGPPLPGHRRSIRSRKVPVRAAGHYGFDRSSMATTKNRSKEPWFRAGHLMWTNIERLSATDVVFFVRSDGGTIRHILPGGGGDASKVEAIRAGRATQQISRATVHGNGRRREQALNYETSHPVIIGLPGDHQPRSSPAPAAYYACGNDDYRCWPQRQRRNLLPDPSSRLALRD